ncbi:uncharacterized protein [Danio rerio]|uniref:Ig-like domain-containing protein n=1 Tax=Danio rerio TaxID=7955 RepID=A0AB32T1L1_DANRE
MRPLIIHLLFQGVLLYGALGWDVTVPRNIRGLRGSCLVIPCSFSYTSYPAPNPRRVVWYQWVSKGYPLVCDQWYPNDVIDKFRGKTDLYRKPHWDCTLLISKVARSHHGEKIYAWIDPENVGKSTYAFYDVTSTIYVDEDPKQPSIEIHGGDTMGESVTVICSTFHTCPYRKPAISLNGINGDDQTNDEHKGNGLWKTSLTRRGVVKTESLNFQCSVTYYGDRTASSSKYKSAKCVHQKITIEPAIGDVTEHVQQIFTCTVYHSCQNEKPTITWNYRDMQISEGIKTLSGLNRATYSKITFVGTIKDHGNRLICTARFSGGSTKASVIIRVQRVLLFDALGWEVKIPQDIHGLKGSCLVIPCSFSYTSNPPKNPRVVWYQRSSSGHPLVYDSLDTNNVIAKFRGKTDLYGNSNCSLLIRKLEQSHDNEKLYTRIDPENDAWTKYEHDDITSTILIDESPQQPNMDISGGERMGDNITVACSAFHTCPHSKPNITLNGVEGSDEIKHESFKDGQWKITLTRKAVVKAESSSIECSVTYHGGVKVTATMTKTAKCVHQKITIEPAIADVTEGVEQIFNCTVYHSCQMENPTITWNYENMQVSEGRKTLSGLDRITYSNITFLGAKEDNGKELTCTVQMSGGNSEESVVLRVKEYQKPDPILNETYFQYMADVIPKITALPRSCVVIPCSFTAEDEHLTRLRVRWVNKKGGYMYHTDPVDVLDNFKGRTKLLGDPDEQNCTLEMDDVRTHDNGPFCFQAEKEKEKYSFNNSCVFIIMRKTPDTPVISPLPNDIEPGTAVTVKCSVKHTCSSHPPEIIWSVPTVRETISHNPMDEGVWETVSTVNFIPTGYEEEDKIVCNAKFWGGKTQSNSSAPLSVKRVRGIKSKIIVLYAIAPSLVFILIFVLAVVFISKRQHSSDCRQPYRDMQGSQPQYEHRRSMWNRFSSRFNMPDERAAWTNRGNRNQIKQNAPERPPKPDQRRSIWSRFSRRQPPTTDLRVEYKANNTCTVSGNKHFSKPHMPSPMSVPKSCHGYY